MSHCTRPAQHRQAAIAQHAQAIDTQGFFNLLTSPELMAWLKINCRNIENTTTPQP